MDVESVAPRRRFAGVRGYFARRRPLPCQEMVELVTAYLEGVLDPSTRARFEHHLEGCDGCATYLEELRATIVTLGTIADDTMDPVFRDRLMLAFAETTGSW